MPNHANPETSNIVLDRTVLANERTFQAWIRTGLASAAAGLGIVRLLQAAVPLWILLLIATVLLLFSVLFFLLAAWRYKHIHLRAAHLNIDALSPVVTTVISTTLAGCALLALGGLLFTYF